MGGRQKGCWATTGNLVTHLKSSCILVKATQFKSFESVKDAVEGKLTTVKLSFFSYLAPNFQPFLAKYQTQAPMILYMYFDIVKLIRSLTQIVVKHDIGGCVWPRPKIDLDKENVYKKNDENKLKALQRRDLVKKEAVTNFLDIVCSCVVAILKMFGKSPIGSDVVRNTSVFNPDLICLTKKEDLKNLKLLLQRFNKIKVLTASHADKASIQYGECFKNNMKLVNKDDDIDRLDDFFFIKLDVGKKYL